MVTLVVIDADEKVALIQWPDSNSAHWALPHGIVRLPESYAQAAARVAERCFKGQPMRWGSVVGRRWAALPDGTSLVRVEERVFLARASRPEFPKLLSAGRPDTGAQWTPRALLNHALQEPHADRTADLVDGYLDGWLPDGPITLD